MWNINNNYDNYKESQSLILYNTIVIVLGWR